MSETSTLTPVIVTEEMYQQLVLNKFQISENDAKKASKEIKNLDTVTNKEEYEKAAEAWRSLQQFRITVEKQAKSLRDAQTALNKKIIEKEKKIISKYEADEVKAYKLKKDWENEQERIKAEAKAAEEKTINERIVILAQYGTSLPIQDLKTMSDIMFDALVTDLKEEFGDRGNLPIMSAPGLGVASHVVETYELQKVVIDPKIELKALIRSLETCMEWNIVNPSVLELVQPFQLRLKSIISEMANLTLK